MSRSKSIIKHYPLTLLCIATIWYLCFLFGAPKTRLNDVPLIDKWVHVAMYLGTCSIFWFEYLRTHRRVDSRFILRWLVAFPVAMSGLIELLQAYATTTRTGDWLDFAANCTGVFLAALLGRFAIPRLAGRSGIFRTSKTEK